MRGTSERNKANGDKTDKKKAVCGGESGSRSRAVQRDGSAPPRFRSVLFCLSVGGVRLVRRPRAQRANEVLPCRGSRRETAEGCDGAASAAPSALPPTCYIPSARLTAIYIKLSVLEDL